MKKVILLISIAVNLSNNSVAQCLAPSRNATLDVNNVRARMNNRGTNWWDLIGNAAYEIPAGSGKHSFYVNSFWIGGLDNNNQLHLAAMRFGQTGSDYWPGPLSQNATISGAACADNDRIYKLNKWQVAEFRQRYNEPYYIIPQDILEWPANGNPNSVAHADAPFVDINSDGIYNAYDGDYPAFAFDEPVDKNFHLLGDQCLWWVLNDAGNIHSETGGLSLGVELQCMAYAYATCDPLNDQTFYRYNVINKSSISYHNTYIGLWTDIDIGFANDDFIGCEVMRNLGYGYNGVEIDGSGGPNSYGAHPPAAGIGLLQGPFADENDGIDNDRDGTTDEQGEHLVMSRFMYHNNAGGGGSPAQTDPTTPENYYQYMQGIWLDGTPMCYGGSAHPSGGGNPAVPALFMFPGDSDPLGYGTMGVPMPPWTEESSNNVPYDRRFLMSAGPFNFNAGETESIHYGALWARDTAEATVFAGVEKLFEVKDFCQQKFENDFESTGCCPPQAEISYQHNSVSRLVFSSVHEGTSYYWDFGDGFTSTAQFPPAHLFFHYGTYEVCLTVENDCGSSTDCETITLSPPPLCVRLKRVEGSGNMARNLEFAQWMHDTLFITSDNRIYHPIYEFNAGPLRIEVLDSTLIPTAEMFIALTGVDSAAGWKMYPLGSTDTVYSTSTIIVGDAQLIPQWGLLVQVKQVEGWNNECGYVLGGSITGGSNWLNWLHDTDYPDYSNWVRSGNLSVNTNSIGSDYGDGDECFENIVDGRWAPYKLASHDDGYGSPTWKKFKVLNQLNNLNSVDVVITANQSKWTRCPVLEIADEGLPTIGNARKMDLRLSPSVDKNGNPDASGTMGMSWFPGYAVNVETGERLNMAFGESSILAGDNGADMIWNPTSTLESPLSDPIVGGCHYIYVFGHNGNTDNDVPYYDEGQFIFNRLSSNDYVPSDIDKRIIARDVMWVGAPLGINGQQLLQSDVKVRLRVRKPFVDYLCLDQVINNTHPLYSFTSTDIGIGIKENDERVEAIQVDIFPNPVSNGQFTIRNNSEEKITRIDLYAVSGELLMSNDLNLRKHESAIINCGNQSAGIYFVVVSSVKSAAVKKLLIR